MNTEMPREVYQTISMLLKSAGLSAERKERILRACRDVDHKSARQAKLMSTKEVAMLASCCKRTVLRAVHRGELDAVRRSSRCIRIREADAKRWIEGEAAHE